MTRGRPPVPFPLVAATVALGGALGGTLRYAVGVAWPGPATAFPWGTLAINLTGAAMLAGLPALEFVRRRHLAPVFLGPGVLGGFTTLSAFAEQARELVATGHTGLAASYVVMSLAGGLAVVLLVQRLTTPGHRTRFSQDEGNE